jgi:hypothetical protein
MVRITESKHAHPQPFLLAFPFHGIVGKPDPDATKKIKTKKKDEVDAAPLAPVAVGAGGAPEENMVS